ncbi:hypothetical protein [Nonomuraea jabiensis]|uniref:alpha-L-rhamnosidase-related protein n=1 Tax=Nonomuraea jabiensis TaxID=882448 RepID=UPI003D736884
MGTGFLATPYLLPVLADTGHLDLAYALLRQDTENKQRSVRAAVVTLWPCRYVASCRVMNMGEQPWLASRSRP